MSLHDVSLDPSIFAWTAAITLLTGIAVGIAPALYETRRLHTNPLKAIGASDRVRQRWRHALVVVEDACSRRSPPFQASAPRPPRRAFRLPPPGSR